MKKKHIKKTPKPRTKRLTKLVKCKTCGSWGALRIADPPELRRAREKKKISLRGMARRIKVSAPFLSDVETGERPCPARILKGYQKL